MLSFYSRVLRNTNKQQSRVGGERKEDGASEAGSDRIRQKQSED